MSTSNTSCVVFCFLLDFNSFLHSRLLLIQTPNALSHSHLHGNICNFLSLHADFLQTVAQQVQDTQGFPHFNALQLGSVELEPSTATSTPSIAIHPCNGLWQFCDCHNSWASTRVSQHESMSASCRMSVTSNLLRVIAASSQS